MDVSCFLCYNIIMFNIFHKKPNLVNQLPLIIHQGIFRKRLSMFQGTALIVSATIGAGVLGIPYAIAKVGLVLGLSYIIGLGILIIGFNLLIGEIAVRTKGNLQLAGLSRKYLGRVGEFAMVIVKYVSGLGVLVIYIIGTGEALSFLLGQTPFFWSIIFFIIGSVFLYNGVESIKVIDFVLSLVVLTIVLAIAGFSFSSIEIINFQYNNLSQLLLPYGVILFAYHGGPAVVEAHSILSDSNKSFKSSILLAGVISIITYAVFAVVVLGVTGMGTTEIATIGLGQKVGSIMLILGNIFAVLAMSTSFLTIGLSLRDSLNWDFKIKQKLAALPVIFIPLIIFVLGLRQFISAINIVGGVFVSLEMLLVILIYWQAKNKGDLEPSKYKLHHTWLLVALLLLALIFGVIYSIVNLF